MEAFLAYQDMKTSTKAAIDEYTSSKAKEKGSGD